MMSDEFLDDNNNDGKACRLTDLNRCCTSNNNSNNLASLKSTGHKKDTKLAHFIQEKGVCASHLGGKSVPESIKLLQDRNLGCELKQRAIEEKGIFEVESSPDELEEISSSSEKENKSSGESSPALDQAKSVPIRFLRKQSSLRGILKYPPGWRRRAISESSALGYSLGSFSDDTSLFGTSLDSPGVLFEFEDEDDSCLEDLNKPKKSVTFPDKLTSVFVFRKNSSILGRRQKNQKKAKRRKDKKLRDSLENFPSDLDEEEGSPLDRVSFCDSCDSGTDVSSSSGCETSASECSGDEAPATETLTGYEQESKVDSNKTKRKNSRNRNRKNKENVRTELETGCYDSD